MSSAASHPYLRLVGGAEPASQPTERQEHARRREVAQENQAASHNLALSPSDPRWVVAVRAYSQLQGTTLTPERRRHVQQLAALLGVRTFEANVIMAIVQDHARHGRSLADAAGTIALMRAPEARATSPWLLWAGAIACAAAAAGTLIAFFVR